ncbi:MAG TPA: dTDP-4-dehydrorhamnose 3,5-epimerase [Magnetospirillum sp.]|nr:dTDP-4-dehydrorhamnose 3,5-epimerase [Magnetospirillum sp.]
MRFSETPLPGAWLIEPELVHDERGFFGRTFCVREYESRGLTTLFVQHSTSCSRRKGTVRGMHFQRPPHQEAKVVTCLKGAIWDVIIDLRPGSATHGQWFGAELTADNRRRMYVPEGFAHGQQALTDDAEIGYLISNFHQPEAAAGFRHDDPAFGIRWPLAVTVVAEKDMAWPSYMPG